MSIPINKNKIAGQWVHSHEESDDQRIVLRSSDYSFPPARGRRALSFDKDGGVSARYPGPTDRSVATAGRWHAEGEQLMLEAPGWSGTYEIESIDPKMMVLRKKG